MLLATYAQVDAALKGCTATDSVKNPRLENPAMVQDAATGSFDLFASFGSSQSGCYRTVEMACKTASGPCDPGSSAVVPLTGVSALKGTGGASFLKNAGTDGNQVIFAGYGGGFTVRQSYIDSTVCSRKDGSDC